MEDTDMKMNSTTKWILGALVVYLLLGALVLGMAREGIAGNTGKVWAAIEYADEKIGRLEDQVLYAYNDRQELVARITEARQARAEMQAAKESGDLEAAVRATETMGLSLNFLYENYPDVRLTEVQVALIDETSGGFNRIKYARDELISSQVRYNRWRIVFFPVGLVFERQSVLGEYEDPTRRISPSKLSG